MARQKIVRAADVGGRDHERPGGAGPGRPGGAGPGRPGGTGPWAELTRALHAFSSTARGTEIIIGQLVTYLRRARLEGRRGDAGDHAALDVLTALRWAMASDEKELHRLQRRAHKLLKAHVPEAVTLNKANFQRPSDLGRGLVAEIDSYRSDLLAGLPHDVTAFADRIARWLVVADERVRLLAAPSIEGVREALIGERELRYFDPQAKPDRIAALVLRAAGVPPKKAWNAVNAAEDMKQSRKNRREQTAPSRQN